MKQFGLQVNEDKTEYVIFNKNKKSKSIESAFKKIDVKFTLEKLNLKYKNANQLIYLVIIIEQNLNLKINEEFLNKKINKYKAINSKLKYLTHNYNLIINTWSTFIRAQFMYGITLFKDSQYVSTWKNYINKYNQTIASSIGVKGHIKAEELTQTLNIPNIHELEIEYRQHIIQQIENLTIQQQEYYNLIDTKRKWSLEINLKRNTQVRIGRQNIPKKDIKHLTKKILDYEGSLKVIQFILKWKSKAQKYFCECHQQRATFKHIMRYKLGMNQEDISKRNQYDLQIDQWNMNQEIKNILKNKHIQEIIRKRKRKESPTIEEGFAHTLFIPNHKLKKIYINYQQYEFKSIYVTNMNLSSLESQ